MIPIYSFIVFVFCFDNANIVIIFEIYKRWWENNNIGLDFFIKSYVKNAFS